MLIPTEEQISQLPRWARVAFAARCARRVLPLYLPSQYGQSYLDDVELAIVIAEKSAATAGANKAAATAHAAAHAAARVAGNAAADSAATAAAHAAHAAATAAAGDVAAAAVPIIAAAARTAAHAAADSEPAKYIVNDFYSIRDISNRERWTDDTPVPQELFGKLWPEGEPSWSIEGRALQLELRAKEAGGQLLFDFDFTADVEGSAIVEPREFGIIVDADVDRGLLADFLCELSDFYAELTGDELVIRDGRIPIEQEVSV